MKRRALIKAIPLGLGAATFSLSFPSLMAAIAGEKKEHWNYNNPENWGDISQEYQVCQVGTQQSPIDLVSSIPSKLDPVEVVYQDIPLKILNNSHTIQVNSNPGNYIILDGKKFDLLQFHFHYPSEHTLMGKTYPMEIHFVHKNSQDEFAVLGVFIKEGQTNPIIQSIWEVMPSQKTEETLIEEVKLSINKLLPKKSQAYRYFGSFTTPPCSEVVHWTVFNEPIEISSAQIDQFKHIFPLNARPIQPLNRRSILFFSK